MRRFRSIVTDAVLPLGAIWLVPLVIIVVALPIVGLAKLIAVVAAALRSAGRGPARRLGGLGLTAGRPGVTVPPDYLEENMGGDLLQGTVELMVLKALSLEPMHGWGLGQRLDQMSGEVFNLPHGSLYPALQRMLRKGSIRSEWRTTDNNRRARYYVITAAGRRQLDDEIKSWRRASAALNAILAR